MSCDRNGTRVGDTAGAAAGVSPVTSKLSNAIGGMSGRVVAAVRPARAAVTGKLDRPAQVVSARIAPARAAVTGQVAGAAQAITGTAAAVSGKTLEVIDRDGLLARVARHPLRQAAGETLLYAHRTALATGLGLAATSGHPAGWAIAAAGAGALYAAGRISPDREKGPLSVQQVPGPRNSARDIPVYQDRKNPDRRVFSVKKVNWVVSGETATGADGAHRSYTRLTGKNVPRAHYYFHGPLSDEQAVGIAAGKIKAYTLPGYAGSVTDREGLSPGWAMLKHSMIRASIAQAES